MLDFSRALSVSVNTCQMYRGREWRILAPSVPFWRVYVHLNACGSMEMEGNTYLLRKGSVTLIAPYTTFTLQASATPTHLFAHAIVGYPYSLLRNRIYQIRSPGRVHPWVEELIQDLCAPGAQEVARGEPRRMLSAIQLVAALLLRIDDERLGHPDVRVALVDAFMRENISRRFTNQELAEMVEMSTSGFIRFFRQKTGVTPARYFHEIRTEQIANLLENTRWSIERIAESCGFADRYHMSKVFKRTTGVSPAAWRSASEGSHIVM